MSACWRYGVLFCNSCMIFGVYYFMEIPTSLQNEIMNSYHSYNGTNNTRIDTGCKVCLGLGEVRYNLLFAVNRWTSAVVCLPVGFLIDKLGNGRSAIMFSIMPLLGSVMFAVGAMSHAPVTTPMYILMVVGYGLLAFGDGSLRFVQARVIAHYFPEMTLIALSFSSFGYAGQTTSLLITPYIDAVVGLIPSVWLATGTCMVADFCHFAISPFRVGNNAKTLRPVTYTFVALVTAAVACGFGVLCAVGLACLLQLQTPQREDDENNRILTFLLPAIIFLNSLGSIQQDLPCGAKSFISTFHHCPTTYSFTDESTETIRTLRELRALPVSYWWFIMCVGFTAVCWIVKQANLPDYLQLQHKYTMTEATRVTGLSPLMVLLTPLVCFVLKKVDCDGIMSAVFFAWMVPLYALLGFCQTVNVYTLALADGIGIGVIGIMIWQLLVILCPAPYVGTLSGLMYLVRNIITALTFVASGYILKRHKVTDLDEALRGYQQLFLMFIILSSTGFICGVVMNVLDFRKACALNSRIGRWRQSNMETMGLMSTIQLSSQYRGIDDVNDDTVNDYSSMKSTTCKDD